MEVVIFSENEWNSPLKYQRHHLAEFFSKQKEVEKVFFYSKASIRKIRINDILKKIRIRNNREYRQRPIPEKIEVVSFNLFPYQKYFGVFNAFLSNKLIKNLNKSIRSWENTVFITYQPIPQSIDVIERFNPFKSVYISVHDFENMYGVSKSVIEIEKRLIEKVDLFTTDSEYLFKKLSIVQERVIPLTPACPIDVVKSSIKERYNSTQIKKVVYFGTIANYLNMSDLKGLSQKGIQVDFLGKEYDVDVKCLNFKTKPNLHAPVDFEDASKILRSYDALILPYKVNERNDLIIPAKIFECFSLGMPVFVPDMKWTNEIGIKGNVYVYSDLEDLLQKFKNFNFNKFQDERKRMLEVAKDNTWDVRFEKLYKWIR